MNSIGIVKCAMVALDKRIQKFPDFGIFQSIAKQLTYLLSVLEGEEADCTKLDKINVGLYALREFEESDPEFARLLFDCQNIAYKILKSQ